MERPIFDGGVTAINESAPQASTTDEAQLESLRGLVAQYEARLARAADLAAHVRHEINNPLTGLIGQAQLLLREELSDKSRRRVQTIEQLALRIRDTAAELREVQDPVTQADGGAKVGEPSSLPR
jgi:signal transduction histidine kinase